MPGKRDAISQEGKAIAIENKYVRAPHCIFTLLHLRFANEATDKEEHANRAHRTY